MRLLSPIVLTRALTWALSCAFVCALAVPAAAATPPAADPEGSVMAELVVRAKAGGPAWWRVSTPASTVWVLGVPGALPKGLRWDATVLGRRLYKASRVVLPPTASFSVLDIFAAISLRGKLRTSAPFEASLPKDLAARFVADAAALRQPPGHYDRWKPALAGLMMVADFRKAAELDPNQPLNTLKALAGRQGVRAAPAASYPAIPMARMLAAELTPQVNQACLADSLQEIEAGAGRVRSAAQAWAIGDVAGALTAERGFERCLAALPNGADLIRRGEADEANAIAQALKAQGAAVAVVELRPLLAQGGVLDRLRAAGYAVKTPDAN